MAIAGYHGIGAGEVQLGAGYLQSVLWSVSNAPEVGRVLVVLRLRAKENGAMSGLDDSRSRRDELRL